MPSLQLISLVLLSKQTRQYTNGIEKDVGNQSWIKLCDKISFRLVTADLQLSRTRNPRAYWVYPSDRTHTQNIY